MQASLNLSQWEWLQHHFPSNSPVGFCEKSLGRVEAWQMAGWGSVVCALAVRSSVWCTVNTQQMVAWFINRHSGRHQISEVIRINRFPFPGYITFVCNLCQKKMWHFGENCTTTQPRFIITFIFCYEIKGLHRENICTNQDQEKKVKKSVLYLDAKLCRSCILHYLQQMFIPLSKGEA